MENKYTLINMAWQGRIRESASMVNNQEDTHVLSILRFIKCGCAWFEDST